MGIRCPSVVAVEAAEVLKELKVFEHIGTGVKVLPDPAAVVEVLRDSP